MPDPLKLLLTPDVWELLNSLPEYNREHADEMNVTLRRQGWPAETVAALLTQLRLRARAKAKFGEFAQRMLFTESGLQQATRLPVAARHAHRFRSAGVNQVADLGCGLGADSLALASAGLAVTAVEADESTAAAAYINLRPFPEAEVVHTTAESWAAEHTRLLSAQFVQDSGAEAPESAAQLAQSRKGMGIWLDPARRNERSRIWDPEEFSPPLSFVTELAATGVPLGVKLGPGIPHELIPPDCEAEWTSVNGELVEVTLWFNALARRDARGRLLRRCATVLPGDHSAPSPTAAELTSAEGFGAGAVLEPAGPQGLAGVLWEPDPAVIRAGLVAELCQQMGGRLLDEHIAYFATDHAGGAFTPQQQDTAVSPVHPQPAELAQGYRILEVMDFSAKRLKRWCADQGITSVEIKKRGVDVVPEQLRQQILPKKKSRGQTKHATLVVTRLGNTRLAAVVQPLDKD